MIRRSVLIGVASLVLSLLFHGVGLDLVFRDAPEPTADLAEAELAALGTAFEDVAERAPEPEPPEPAQTPEPPVETPPEPEAADIPTSEALVASENPRNTPTPDTGSAESPEPQAAGTPDPETADPPGGAPPAQIAETPSAPPPASGAAEEDMADAEQVEPGEPEQAPTPEIALAVPVQDLSPATPPVTEAEVPDASQAESPDIPVVVASLPEPEVFEAEEDVQDQLANTENANPSPQAVTASVRPPLPERRRPGDDALTADASREPEAADSNQAQLIESPLTLYQRDGVDLFAGQSSSRRSQGLSFLDSRSTGNSSETNYAGRVLTHLNRVPSIRVSGRGTARVFFQIDPDGSVAWVDVVDSSGSADVERAAKAQVRRAAPFPVPPGGASRKLSFVYRIY